MSEHPPRKGRRRPGPQQRPGQHRGRPSPRRSGPPAGGAEGQSVIYGFHSVAEALKNPARRAHRLLATANALHRLAEMVPGHDWPEPVLVKEIDRMLGADAVHQGVALLCEPLPEPELEDVAGAALIVALDQVTDPHNVGAVLRSAAAFGASALLVTARHSPPETGVLAKSASGALEHVALVRVRNLSKALEELREADHHLVGLDGEASESLGENALPERLVLVLGAEGKGLREKTKETCDRLVRLPTRPPIASLNVSNAAAIALYEASRSRSSGSSARG
ncbi:23S rRNA (guanosine(2251)-2'-O)-methyltransferase RlmB [Afifella sp. IM 167]|uniref:23S rRNA (guanosine(2251)-2'-O)-methyltransferase RlmB n=1 Tax=Afifella sp. IM 167 TaxID=2033586 RepID=UPI001CCC381F|nr:23S rRNA (guanosine(2251)-2'-O)-methyltransferase RlmB [Afifella sp. IM 167]MBZ8134625.1 23S rRNA (guanosine(2251)-2'-O)-methyltransferase RlmB [Afifella sp. IM 167]